MSDITERFEKANFTDSDSTELAYRIFVPEKAKRGEKCPLFLFLHGAGERGSNNELQLHQGTGLFFAAAEYADDPCVVVVPQCPDECKWVNTPWDKGSYSIDRVPVSKYLSAATELVAYIEKRYGTDPHRRYVSGISMGGYATWDIIARNPDMFAAAVPVCGGGDPSKAPLLKKTAVRAFHSADDPEVPVSGTREMAAALKAAGADAVYTEYDGLSHNSWTTAFATEGLLEWLLSCKN